MGEPARTSLQPHVRKGIMIAHQMNRTRLLLPVCIAFILMLNSDRLVAEEGNYIAIVPALHDPQHTSDAAGAIQLSRQSFVIFLFRNAAAVCSEAEFLNTLADSVDQDVSLPSTGHDENGDAPGGRISNGVLSVRMWVEGERAEPLLSSASGEEAYTLHLHFHRFQRRTVRAMFWLQTSLEDVDATPGLDTAIIPDGKRGLMIDLSHAAIWKNMIDRISVTVVLCEGLQTGESDFHATPESYDVRDSTLQWQLSAIEPSPDENIEIAYSSCVVNKPAVTTMARLSRIITGRVYDELTAYVRSQNE
jgi:hypothetical protein